MVILPLEFMPPLGDKIKAGFHIVGADNLLRTDLTWVKEDLKPYVILAYPVFQNYGKYME